jgi:ADP-ribosylation factor related protein 1
MLANSNLFSSAGKSTFLETAKTSFTKGYKGMNLKSITSTVGLNIGQIDFGGMTFHFWDLGECHEFHLFSSLYLTITLFILGGQKELQGLWDKYYDESHGVIYVIDSNDRDRMDESKELFDKMIKSEYLSGVPLLILANKQDILDCMGVREIKPVFQQHGHLIGRRDCLIIPTSGLKGEGVDEAIKWLKDAVKRNSMLRPPKS